MYLPFRQTTTPDHCRRYCTDNSVNVVRMGCGITLHALFPPPFSSGLCSSVPFKNYPSLYYTKNTNLGLTEHLQIILIIIIILLINAKIKLIENRMGWCGIVLIIQTLYSHIRQHLRNILCRMEIMQMVRKKESDW